MARKGSIAYTFGKVKGRLSKKKHCSSRRSSRSPFDHDSHSDDYRESLHKKCNP